MGPGDALRPLLAAPGFLLRVAQRMEQEGQRILEPEQHEDVPTHEPPLQRGGAAVVLEALLENAVLQSTTDAEEALACQLILQLVPDEARMLTQLERSGWQAAVDVLPRGDDTPLENCSLLGRHSGVALIGHAPDYLRRLRHLGLVGATPERPGHDEEYEVLLAEPSVLRAVKAGRRRGRGPIVRKYGVELSTLGALVLRVGRRAREDALRELQA